MPTVPIYDTPRVDQTALPSQQFAAPDMPDVAGKQTQQLGQAMSGLGAVGMKIADQLQAERDDAQTKALDNALADRMRMILHNKDTGYLSQVGQQAANGRDATADALAKARDEISGGLENDVQRKMYSRVANARMQSALLQVDTHAAQQTRVWHDGESVARFKSNLADMVANSAGWNQKDANGKTTGAYNMARATAVGELEGLAAMRGLSGDGAKMFVAENMAKAYAGVLTNMVSLGQSKTARDYLEQVAPEIAKGAPDQLDNLRTLVKQAGVKDESLTLSGQLKGGLNEQVGALKGMFDKGEITADVYDATRQRVEHNWQMRKAQQAEGEKALMGNAYDWVLKNPGKDILDMPAGMYNSLKNTGHLASLATFARTSGKPITDDATYYGLRRMAMEDPPAFVDRDLMKSRHLLSQSDWQALVQLQTSIGKGEAKAMESQRVLKATLSQIKAEVAAIGIDMTPKEGSPQAQETARFTNALTRALDDATRSKGSPLTPDESRRIGMSMVREGVEQGSGIFGIGQTKKRGYQIATDPSIKPGANFVAANFDSIPQKIRQGLLDEIMARTGKRYQANRIPDSIQQEIERAYTAGIEKGRF